MYPKVNINFKVEIFAYSAVITQSRELIIFSTRWSNRQLPQAEPKVRITCKVLSFEMEVIEFVDVAYIHLFLV